VGVVEGEEIVKIFFEELAICSALFKSKLAAFDLSDCFHPPKML